MQKRALRRHHRRRLFRKRKHYWGGFAAKVPKRARQLINTPKPCSCAMCSGNFERKHGNRVTRQERVAELKELEQTDAQ